MCLKRANYESLANDRRGAENKLYPRQSEAEVGATLLSTQRYWENLGAWDRRRTGKWDKGEVTLPSCATWELVSFLGWFVHLFDLFLVCFCFYQRGL